MFVLEDSCLLLLLSVTQKLTAYHLFVSTVL